MDMAIILGIKRTNEEDTLALSKRVRPPFWPCCVCSKDLDLAFPVHVCDTCKKTHCSGCGAWLDDGARKCTNCLAGAGCELQTVPPASPQPWL